MIREDLFIMFAQHTELQSCTDTKQVLMHGALQAAQLCQTTPVNMCVCQMSIKCALYHIEMPGAVNAHADYTTGLA